MFRIYMCIAIKNSIDVDNLKAVKVTEKMAPIPIQRRNWNVCIII